MSKPILSRKGSVLASSVALTGALLVATTTAVQAAPPTPYFNAGIEYNSNSSSSGPCTSTGGSTWSEVPITSGTVTKTTSG